MTGWSVAWLLFQWQPWKTSWIMKLWFSAKSRRIKTISSGRVDLQCSRYVAWLFHKNSACLHTSSTNSSLVLLIGHYQTVHPPPTYLHLLPAIQNMFPPTHIDPKYCPTYPHSAPPTQNNAPTPTYPHKPKITHTHSK